MVMKLVLWWNRKLPVVSCSLDTQIYVYLYVCIPASACSDSSPTLIYLTPRGLLGGLLPCSNFFSVTNSRRRLPVLLLEHSSLWGCVNFYSGVLLYRSHTGTSDLEKNGKGIIKKWGNNIQKCRILWRQESALSIYMFSSYSFSFTVRKRYGASGESFIGTLKAPFKHKPGSVCAEREVVVHLQKNRSHRRSLTPLSCDPGKAK